MSGAQLSRLKAGAIEEAKKLFGIFLYIWVLLTVLSLHKAFIFNEDIITYQQGFAVLNALALAKVVLLGQHFGVGERTTRKLPLVYPILVKAALFTVILMVFHVAEETLIGVLHGKTAAESVPTFGDGSLQALVMISLIVFVAMLPFFGYLEIERAIGAEELHALLFTRRRGD